MVFPSISTLRLIGFTACMLSTIGLHAQSSHLLIEEYMVHDGVTGLAELEGQTTYRFYVECTHPDDFVSAVYGGQGSPLMVEVDSPMFNSPFASGSTGGGINPLILNYFPEAAYDSWITIGLDQAAGAGEMDISALESPEQPFMANFSANGESSGMSVSLTDEAGGAWFLLSGMTNGYAGDDLRVLIMQITSASLPSGLLNIQVIPAVGSSDSEQVHQGFSGTDVWDIDLSSMAPGCTDFEACNYDAFASEDDGTCEYESCAGCTDVFACNYDESATIDDGSCSFIECLGCTDSTACNFDPDAIYNDGTCDYFSCEEGGCTLEAACNYNPDASYEDGTCDFVSCAGCMDASADNFDPTALIDDGTCEIGGCLNPLACNFNVLANIPDGSCDFASCVGCLDTFACNYDEAATISDVSSCVYAENGLDCEGNCLLDEDLDGICDGDEVAGCTDALANNFNNEATDDDGSCLYSVAGCLNSIACNFNVLANENDGSCEFTSCAGCMIELACNYDEAYTLEDNASCIFVEPYYDCQGDCLGDNDSDGVCNELEVLGCTDEAALNYDSYATDNNGSCTYPSQCNDIDACNYVPYEAYCLQIEPITVHEGMVGEVDFSGMTTYRVYALCENEDDFVSAVAGDDEFSTSVHSTSSFFQSPAGGPLAENSNPMVFPFIPSLAYDSWVTIGLDQSANGAEGELGVSVLEGNEPWVIPFENGGSIEISDDLGGLWYILNGATNGIAGDDLRVLLGQFTTAGNLSGQMFVQFFIHGDGVNNGLNKVIGLQDACGAPAFDNCSFPESGYSCEGSCLSDLDSDGICDEFEIDGCTDALANNFNAMATDDDGSCDFTVDPCVLDVIPPFFTSVPADSVIQCDQAMPTVMAIAEDACDDNVQVMFVDGPIEFVLDCPPFNYLCTRTFIATDDAGNTASAVQMISVRDTLAPEFVVLPEALIQVNEQEDESVPEPFAVIQDACDGNASWSSLDVLLSEEASVQTLERTYTASDQCGNTSVFVQTLIVTVATYGCADPLACNYLESVTNEDGSCTYPEDWYTCEGNCIQDADGDGVCDLFEIEGCTVENACNFNLLATDDDGTCDFCSCSEIEVPVFGLDIDTVAVHASGNLEGMTTYRLYVTTETSEDFVSSVYGNDVDTLILGTSSTFHQDDNGSLLPQNLNADLVGLFPDLAFDSWVTIGLDGPAMAGENLVNALGASGDLGWSAAFEDGSDIVMDDPVGGSWFILNGGSNGIAGDDLRVLIGQVTTDGTLSGQLHVQVFENGDNSNASLHHFSFEGAEWTNAFSGQNTCGCTDEAAFNYDPLVEYEDGSCIASVFGCLDELSCDFNALANTPDFSCTYALEGYGCDGECLADTDEDGVCDVFEIAGCTDVTACNYAFDATDEDESCTYADFGYDCLGLCLNDTDDDGICDALEVEGCTDLAACNYSLEATEEDGSCEYAASNYDCDGNCLEDADLDGICDAFEIEGCTDLDALNFDPTATDDDGSCAYCALEASLEVTDATCNGSDDGAVLVSAIGAYPNDSLLTFVLLPDGAPQSEGAFVGLLAGEYAVEVVDAAGCFTTVLFEVMEPEPLLVLLDNVVGTEQGLNQGAIAITVTGGSEAYVFAWTQLDGSFTSASEDIDNLEGGTYQVTVSDENGCSVTSFEIVVETIVGVEESMMIDLSLFPNPVVSNLTIEIGHHALQASVHIHDAAGRLVYTKTIAAGTNRLQVDCSRWMSGMYHVVVLSGEWNASEKVFVQR